MPKIAGREVRGEFLALQLFDKIGKAVTPSEINAHVGRGDYAAKYISFLRGRHGFEFSVQKDGRSVVSYTLVSEPDNAADVRKRGDANAVKLEKNANKVFTQAAKASRPKAAKSAKPVKVRQSKQTAQAEKVVKAARNVLKDKADKQADALLAELGMRNAGEYAGGTYSVDPDWDSMDGIDVANFLK